MIFRLLVLSFVFVSLSFKLAAQSPGGVGTANLRGWFDANTGVTTSGSQVTSWTDRSGVGNATQGTNAERPSLISTINYNNAINFDGNDDNLDLIDRVASGTTGVSAYAVAIQTNTSRDSWGSVFNGQANGPSWTGGGFGLVALNVGSTQHGLYVRDYNSKFVSFPITNGSPTLMSGTWNGTTANNVQTFNNGTSVGTDPYTPGSVGDQGSSWIGSGDGTNRNYCFYGDIAELIIFNTGLNTTNNNKVMSYLGMKYGITLGTNYVNSANTTVYSVASYNDEIFGIGRDDGSGLIQKQSQASDGSAQVYLSSLASNNASNTGSFSNNLSHIMVGANNGLLTSALATLSDLPSGNNLVFRLDREWKITNTNLTSETFSMDITVSPLAGLGLIPLTEMRVMLDDDGTFASGTGSVLASGSGGITMSYSGNTLTIAGLSSSLIPAGTSSFLTIGYSSTPLPIEIANFTAVSDGDRNVISWNSSDASVHQFELERSTDGINFSSLAVVDRMNGRTSYTFVDDNISNSETYYYRLKMLNPDSRFEYGPTVSVNSDAAERSQVYPNPFASSLMLDADAHQDCEASIEIKDAYGKTLHLEYISMFKGVNHIPIDAMTLPPGAYTLTLAKSDGMSHFKIVKQ